MNFLDKLKKYKIIIKIYNRKKFYNTVSNEKTRANIYFGRGLTFIKPKENNQERFLLFECGE